MVYNLTRNRHIMKINRGCAHMRTLLKLIASEEQRRIQYLVHRVLISIVSRRIVLLEQEKIDSFHANRD